MLLKIYHEVCLDLKFIISYLIQFLDTTVFIGSCFVLTSQKSYDFHFYFINGFGLFKVYPSKSFPKLECSCTHLCFFMSFEDYKSQQKRIYAILF